MAKKPTAEEVVKYCREFEKAVTKYGKGMQCCKLTASNINSKAKQSHISKWYNEPSKQDPSKSNKDYLMQFASKGYYGADCCGMVKGVVEWGYRVGGPNSGGYDAKRDYTIKQMADMCTDVKTDLSKAEVGEFTWTADYGHCAIITSNGGKSIIESAPSCDGVRENKIEYRPKGYFVACGKYPGIDYTKKEETSSTSSSSGTTISTGEYLKINKGAKYGGSAKGVDVPDKYEGVLYTAGKVGTANGEKCVLVIELNSWVPLKYITKIPSQGSKTVTNCQNLNVRKTPGGSVVKIVPVGTVVNVYGTDGDWTQIAPSQWVSSKYLK